VLVVEKGRRVGGVSVHTGTIPSKTLRETVLNLSGWRERGFYGRSYRVKHDIDAGDLMVRLRKTLDHEVEVLEHQFSRNAVKHTRGEGRFVGLHEIEVTADNGDTQLYRGAQYSDRLRDAARTARTMCRSTARPCSTRTRSSTCRRCRAASP